MKKSKDGILLSRRDALRLSATAGMGIALTATGHASDSIRQLPTRNLETVPHPVARWPTRNTAKCAAFSMGVSTPSRDSLRPEHRG